MGISNELNQDFLEFISTIETKNLSLVELGDQDHFLENRKARDVFKGRFQSYISLDLWKRPGVSICDLSEYHENLYSCDIVTNFGTSEHVEPHFGHYNCWKNINNWIKIGGFIVSEIPEKGHWSKHGRFTYTENFFRSFEDIGFSIQKIKRNFYNGQGNLIFCVLKKEKDVSFFDYESFKEIVSIDENFTMNESIKENNPKNIMDDN